MFRSEVFAIFFSDIPEDNHFLVPMRSASCVYLIYSVVPFVWSTLSFQMHWWWPCVWSMCPSSCVFLSTSWRSREHHRCSHRAREHFGTSSECFGTSSFSCVTLQYSICFLCCDMLCTRIILSLSLCWCPVWWISLRLFLSFNSWGYSTRLTSLIQKSWWSRCNGHGN